MNSFHPSYNRVKILDLLFFFAKNSEKNLFFVFF